MKKVRGSVMIKEEVEEYLVRFRVLLAKRDMSRAELSRITRININTIHSFFREKRIPRADDAVLIARALGVTVEYFITGDEGVSINEEAMEIATVLTNLNDADKLVLKGVLYQFLRDRGYNVQAESVVGFN